VNTLLGGFERDPAFGGAGYNPLAELPAHGAYATLVPKGNSQFNCAFDNGGSGGSKNVTIFSNVTVGASAGQMTLGNVVFGTGSTLAIAPQNTLKLDGAVAVFAAGSQLANSGTIDLAGSLIVQSGEGNGAGKLKELVDQIKTGRNSPDGLWKGTGITSSAARDNQFTGIAAILNDDGSGKAIRDTFADVAVDATSILLKHTWNGDANLDGVVNADDYFLTDSGYVTQKGGWYNGDFNYDSVVNADDYFLIDSAFIGQTATLSARAAGSAHLIVPEPSSLLWAVGTLALLRRRRGT
jgi:hypothetical protein